VATTSIAIGNSTNTVTVGNKLATNFVDSKTTSLSLGTNTTCATMTLGNATSTATVANKLASNYVDSRTTALNLGTNYPNCTDIFIGSTSTNVDINGNLNCDSLNNYGTTNTTRTNTNNIQFANPTAIAGQVMNIGTRPAQGFLNCNTINIGDGLTTIYLNGDIRTNFGAQPEIAIGNFFNQI
jgi:hypothetical protein